MAAQVGKVYVRKKRGAELIVSHGGKGSLYYCGQATEMEVERRNESTW